MFTIRLLAYTNTLPLPLILLTSSLSSSLLSLFFLLLLLSLPPPPPPLPLTGRAGRGRGGGGGELRSEAEIKSSPRVQTRQAGAGTVAIVTIPCYSDNPIQWSTLRVRYEYSTILQSCFNILLRASGFPNSSSYSCGLILVIQ